jgi:N-carbamoylputrescine amidase
MRDRPCSLTIPFFFPFLIRFHAFPPRWFFFLFNSQQQMVPVVASNRYGTEILLHDDGKTEKQRITFYGRTFITDNTGAKVVEVPRVMEEGNTIAVITSVIDPEANRNARLAWGLFRDRRPDLYGVLLTKDGSVPTK